MPNRPITLAHSPDPDDAFMWWPLGDADTGAPALIDTEGLVFRTIADDIESLNARAARDADLDITALSVGAWPHVRDRYAITACGASMGDGYGPRVVAPEPQNIDWLRADRPRIAIPGERTTAFLTLRLLAGPDVRFIAVPFDKVTAAVARGDADAALVIHEGQLTFQDEGLHLVADLGQWWTSRTGLPLPLGLNTVRRALEHELGVGALDRIARVLRRSVEHAMSRRDDGLAVAMGFARGLTQERADRFVRMYVNDLTIDMGARGRDAISRLLSEAASAGLCPDPGPADVVGLSPS